MGKRVGMEVSIGAAEAVKLARAECIAAYPITPQTHIVEHLSELVNNGELDAEFIPVESEHSAMSVCCGCSAVGARTFTCTSSQGMALMNEILFIVPAMRLPIVMILANRSLSSPLSIWNDHSDIMSIRDTGWIQLFAENGQEVVDHVLFAFKVAENPNVLLPVMINMDGFILTHVIEPIELPDQDVVDKFLPPYNPVQRLHPDHPITMGAFAIPDLFTETKKAQEEAIKSSFPYIIKAWDELGNTIGRYYNPIEKYKSEGKKILFITMGSFGETVMTAIDMMEEKGIDVGLIKIRLWRPFPEKEFLDAIKDADILIVIDRAITFGGMAGPVTTEIRSVLYHEENMPAVVGFICGLAGRDVTPKDYERMVEIAKEKVKKGKEKEYEIYGVRE
ncbi:MAG: pyruvate ferredoxin oxidoreductase [Deltaproteobacteria bacterium]|nr:MAG: pyruvate ferredoxin oxidoreductase [Deltaproteobacteria bacterium]